MSKEYLKLFSSCIPVKGISRSTICDLQRNTIYFVPNTMYDLFSTLTHSINIEEIERTGSLNSGIFSDYLSFLIDNELGWRCSAEELLLFPIMNTEWEFPAFVSNCIIDVKHQLLFLDKSFLNQLEELCCNYIQIRFFTQRSLQELQEILNVLNTTQIKAIELVFQFYEVENFEQAIVDFIQINPKVRTITVSGGSQNKVLKKEDLDSGSVFITKKLIDSEFHCGIVEFEQFSINIPHYTESLKHNTCLNRKISIDADGNIKNCPSMVESFGNIIDTGLMEVIENPRFKSQWNLRKDHVTVCKDCEFRHICTDCRAYLENPEDLLSKPLKCGYDPISCKWQEWSEHELKQRAIAHYNIKNII
jgi:SPASM domain peptide maturase of grasp-with-spasm system